MKKLILLIFLMSSLLANAQVPQGINYQAVVRAANGTVAANTSGIFQITFIDKADNSIDYVESNEFTTDEFGLVDFVIGHGVPNGAAFSSLDWTRHFQIKVEVNLGQGLVTLGTQDLVSVPYALEAGHANMSLNQLNDVNVAGAVSGEVLMFDGTNWTPATVSGGFALPFLGTDSNLTSFSITNNSASGGTAVYGKSIANSSNAIGVKGESTGTQGNGVYGIANGASSNGVQGLNTTGTGVRGESNSGTGVLGYSSSGVALSGSTLSGTAVSASSVSGYAFESNGNVKIAGGNTNPGDGKVLTSDAQGNATWQNGTPNVAFKWKDQSNSIPSLEVTKVEFNSPVYDYGNGYYSDVDAFIAPVNGIYHFDGGVWFKLFSMTNCFTEELCALWLTKLSDNVGEQTICFDPGSFTSVINSCGFSAKLSCDVFLNAGDKVYMEVRQGNDDDVAVSGSIDTYFNGHLVFRLN